MKYLRQSTAATVVVGPFESSTDGKTDQTALTDQSANCSLEQNGTDAGAVTLASWTHNAKGHYAVGLSTTHTNTIGRLRLVFSNSATYLPVWEDFSVLSQPVYDALFGSVALSTLGGTAQTGDAFARLGAAGAGLTALGDTRIANLDAAVSSRSTFAAGQNVGAATSVTGAVGSVASFGTLVSDVATAVWGATVRTLSAFGFTPNVGNVTGTLTATERNAIADALLDRTDAIETAITPRQAQRLIVAVLAGKSTEASGTWTVRRQDGTTTALTVNHDASGTRSSVTIGSL